MSNLTSTNSLNTSNNIIPTASLVIFIIVTIFYFIVVKKKLILDNIQSPGGDIIPEGITDYYYANLSRLAIYFFMVIITQFILNAVYLGNKCHSSTGTIGIAAFYTFIPWFLIFGVLLGVLMVFPGFKSAFSDVVGYFVVAGKSNDIFSTILIDPELQDTMNKDGLSADNKSALSKSAEAIMKICGNKSVIINQMNPENFVGIWNTLKPLMNTDILKNRDELLKTQTELLRLVVLRDNIGEAFWYVYSAIFISSIVYYNLATQGCELDAATIKANRDQYIQEQETLEQQNANNNATVYSSDSTVQT